MSGSSEEQKEVDKDLEKKSRKRRREASKTKALTPLEGFELPLFGAVTLKREIFRNTRRLIPIGDMRPEFKGKQRTNIVHRDGKFKVEGSLIEGSSAAIWFEELKRIPLPDVLDDKWEEGMCPFCYDSDGRRSRLEGKGKVMRRCYIHAFLRTDSTNLLHIEVQRRRTLFVNQEKGKWRPVPPFCSRPTCLATLMRHWARRNVFGASVETDIIPPFLLEEQEELLRKDPNAPDKLEATSEAFKYLEYARISEKGSDIHFEKSFLDVCPFCYENGARKPLRTLAVSLNGKTFYLKGRHITRSSFLSFLRADASREIARECVKRFTLVVGNWPGRRLPAFCAQQFCIYTLYRSWGAGSTFVFQPNTRTPPRRPSLLRYLLPPHSLIWRRCLQWEAEVLQDLTFKPGDCPFCFKDTKRFHDGSVKVKRIGRLNFNRFLKTGDPSHRIYRECIRRGMRLDGFAPKEKFPHFCNRETCLGFFYRRWRRFRRRGKPLYAAIKYVPPPSETEPITRYATTLCSGLTRISQDPDSDYLYLNDYPDLPHLKDYFPIARDAFQLLGCRENSFTLQRSYPWIARSIRRHASSLFSSIPAVMLSYLTPTEIEVFNYLMKDYRSESLEYLPFYNPLTSEPITEIMSQLLDATDYYPVHSSILKPWEPGNDHAVPRERLLNAPIEDVLCVASRRKAKHALLLANAEFLNQSRARPCLHSFRLSRKREPKMRRLEKLLKRKRALVYESLKLSTGADEVAYSNRFLNIFHKNVHEAELSELTKELGGCFGAHEGENRASKVVKYMPSSSLVEYIRSLVEKREFSSLALRQPMKGFLDDSALIALAVAVEEMAAEIVSSIWASSSGLMEVGDEDLMSAVLEAASFQYQAATVYSPSFPSSNQEAQTAHALHVVALGMNRIEVMLGLPSNIQELWSLMLQRFEKERASQAETTEYDIVEKAFHARNDRSFKDRTHPGVRTDFDGSPAYVSNAFFAVESSSLPSSALT